MRFLNKISLLGLIIFIYVAAFPLSAYGEMTSTNYYIYADSVGYNGGLVSTSTIYTLTDTTGDVSAGSAATSTIYSLVGGFQAANLDENLSFVITTTTLDLGTLSKTAVSSATTSIVVACNAVTGYSISLSDVSGSMPTAVSDGTVTAGADEYGVSTSGGNAATSGDVAVANGLVLASATTDIVQTTTTVAFKASYNTVSAGTYSQALVLTAAANF